MDFNIPKDEINQFQKLDEVIKEYSSEQGMLIRILQKGQEIFGYLPVHVQTYISDKVGIPISTVNGVVSFYSLFSQKPRGKYTIGVCLGTACYVKGAKEVLEAIKEDLQISVDETSMDGLFTLKATRCIGACGLAPVITVNEDVYGRLSPADIPAILYKYIKTHKETDLNSLEMK